MVGRDRGGTAKLGRSAAGVKVPSPGEWQESISVDKHGQGQRTNFVKYFGNDLLTPRGTLFSFLYTYTLGHLLQMIIVPEERQIIYSFTDCSP